ncbi:MAG: LuxR C-terminal-related transcriptional regulator [Duncaniella sp.]|nr:LuxR C-terminal-related transcriptional regulator [Duncaniella sp.]
MKNISITCLIISIVMCLSLSQVHASRRVSCQWTAINPAVDRLRDSIDIVLRADRLAPDSLVNILDRFRLLARQSGNPVATIQSSYFDAEAAYNRDISHKQMHAILDAIGKIDSIANTYEWYRVNYLRLKLLLYSEKDYPAAYRVSESLLIRVLNTDLRRETATIIANQGLLFFYIGDYDEALRLQYEAREYFSGLAVPTDSLKNELNLCNTLAATGNVDEAEKSLRIMAADSEVRRHHKIYCNTLMSLFYFTHEDAYAHKALDEALMTSDSVLQMKCLQNLSEIYYRDGKMQQCIENQKKVLGFFSRRNDQDMIVPLRGLVEIYDHTGPRDSALLYMRRLLAAQDTFNRVQSTAIISRIKARSEILGLKNKIALTETKAALERERSVMLGVLCVAILLLGILVAAYIRRRSQIERKMKELENDRLAVSLQNERLQNEKFQQAIDSQERELTSKALLLLNKNQLLNQLLEQIHEFDLPPGQERSLIKKIRGDLNNDKAWDDFTAHFEQVNPQFFKTLKEFYPSLTDKDLKMCAYIRMGFTVKQIAQMLSVLPESVNTTRYRLRRKMGLNTETILEDHLRGI